MIKIKTSWILCFVYVLLIQLANAQIVDSNIVNWNENRKMRYGDYYVHMPADSMRDEDGNWVGLAATAVLISKIFQTNGEYLEYNIYAYVDKNKSYIKPDTFLGDDEKYVLEHEQIHFDISELYARKMRQFVMLNGTKCNEDYIEHALDSIDTRQWAEQRSFDRQSFTNEYMQNYWRDDIKKQLAILGNYKARKGRVKCKK